MAFDRAEMLRRARAEPQFDAIVVGAGINGLGTFWDLSLQGLRCLIVDRADFCGATSAAPSRMIHGGLKYLETGEFRLVAESTLERNRLLRNAGHLVHPLPMVVPARGWTSGMLSAARRFFGRPARFRERGVAVVLAGLKIYDFLGRHERVLPRSRFLGRRRLRTHLPGIAETFVAGCAYHDAWITGPERLGLELAIDGCAAGSGSVALNRAELVGRDGDALLIRDTGDPDARPLRVAGTVVVNAAGAWIDHANDRLGADTAFIGGTKGSHILLDHPDLHDRLDGRMIYFESADSRICLVFPYLGRVLLGSTDIPLAEPDEAVCSDDEIAYLFEALRGIFPGLAVGTGDIVYTYSGVRPLVRSGADDPGAISRDHSIPALEVDGSRGFPVLSLVGGKWTTFRAFAEQATDEVLRRLGRPRRVSTEARSIGGGTGFTPTDAHRAALAAALHHDYGTPPAHAAHLVRHYGSRAEAIAAFCAEAPDGPVAGLPDYTERELTFLALREMVVHLDDLVLRRTPIAVSGLLNDTNAGALCRLIAGALGWEPARAQRELTRLRSVLSRHHRVTIQETRQAFDRRQAPP